MNAATKQQFGQFFTTNSDYILQGLEKFILNKEIIDPFAGGQDLIRWAEKNHCNSAHGFDCDKNLVDNRKIFFADSINQPRKYKFVFTNPPYLHKNKATQSIKNNFFSGENAIFEDLYQVSIKSILNCEEGILIVPLNFLCAENSKRVRILFFNRFEIVRLNVFSEQVFDDTTYNVVAFYFRKKLSLKNKIFVPTWIYPEGKKIGLVLEERLGWQFGGEFVSSVKAVKNNLGVHRLTEELLIDGEYKAEIAIQNIKHRQSRKIDRGTQKKLEDNILFLRAIDSKNGKKIQLENIRDYDLDGLAGKSTSRNSAHLIFREKISIEQQKELLIAFNTNLNLNREKYFSFFLTNFRDHNRKRISFDFAYKFLNFLYQQMYEKQPALF